jgi:hypothetical protein
MTPEALVGLLAEPERLRVVAALALGARTHAEVAAATGLDIRVVGKALRRLEAGGLVEGLVLREDLFKEVAKSVPAPPPETHGYADQGVEAVVRTFVRNGRLVRFPAQHSKRKVLLEHVVASFEPGRRYPEVEVNVVLRAWCEGGKADYVTLRRYLVDGGLLARDAGLYWRSGGWVDTAF